MKPAFKSTLRKVVQSFRHLRSAFVLVVCATTALPLMAASPDAYELEMSIEEALDMVYEEFLSQSAPENIKPYATMTILGKAKIGYHTITEFIRRNNPDFDEEIARCFVEIGHRYGLRGDVAICQAIVETGWFKYTGGTAVRPEHHNYCGLGVTTKGMTGACFETVALGVTAHLQHLFAYACTQCLPKGEEKLDPRFDMVKRGCAARWHDLNGRWAMNNRYSDAILSVYASLVAFDQRSTY